MTSNLPTSPQLEQIHGEIGSHFRALAYAFALGDLQLPLQLTGLSKIKFWSPILFYKHLGMQKPSRTTIQVDLGMDDSKEYKKTLEAMDIVGISLEEQEAIFRVVAAILHLGIIKFAKGEEPNSSIPKYEKSKHYLKIAAELFMCDEQAQEDSLCKRIMCWGKQAPMAQQNKIPHTYVKL
ncbi:hypothetical protein AALP_AA3G256100 [Arabis alpina]|uniref:Myosin motor domain-containing protein n=1 Tax=Arabis alpina TaxID=50452 RepID=A0A087HBM6_ARAAL|nr:hypothetical protein AALP_AA3G256100 [Arabis alpina]